MISALTFHFQHAQAVPHFRQLIEAYLHITYPKIKWFVQDPAQIKVHMVRQQRSYAWLLGLIGGIALLVGGVGIMNVMMAVIERQMEIGLRQALGADRRSLLTLFYWKH